MGPKQTHFPLLNAVLTALLISNVFSVSGQTTCNNGQGRVLYERLPNQQLQGFDDDVVRDTAPPFRVLEKCQDLCLRDRTATNNLVRACTSFDFQPGSRIASFSGSAEYEESTCYLTREQPAPEGIGILMLVPNSVHFTEVCLSSNRPERECPSRRYVFERHPRKKLKLPVSDIKEITAANRSDCEDKCLNEFSFVCRSANFDSSLRICSLSRFTRRTHPELLEDDPNSDYLENTCLNAERRCDGLAVYVKEENKRLGGPFEVDIFNNMTLEECQTMCIRAEKYFCRSVEFDDQSKQCILSEEDSISQKDDISISSSPTHHFYDLVCLDNQRGAEYPDNSVTSHLFSSGRRPDTAFQRYRNSRLGGEFHSEITGRSLSECLDECLRQTSFQCRSAVYSDRFRTCRLSRYNQRDGMRIIYDADYDYYENLMLGNDNGGEDRDHDRDRDRDRPNSNRPDLLGTGINYRPTYLGDSDKDRNKDRYPPSTDDQVANRYPPADGKIPYDRYPGAEKPDANNGGDRYPGNAGDKYPTGGNRYPNEERYPGGYTDDLRPGNRYPDDRPGNRYPNDLRPISRYPDDRPGNRYPDDLRPGNRHPDDMRPGNRYPDDVRPGNRYPDDVRTGNRYPDLQRPGNAYPDDGRPISRYPDDDRSGNRYPDDLRPGVRYPQDFDNRYPVDENDRGRYPSRYPDQGYPSRKNPGDKDYYYPGSRNPFDSRYPEPPNDIYPSSRYPDKDGPLRPGRYPSDNSIEPYPHDRRVSAIGRYPTEDRFPGYDRLPSGQNPVDANRQTPSPQYGRPPLDSRYPTSSRYPADSPPRYPADDRYPETRYQSPTAGRYPMSENRFPVGNEQNPFFMYKYGNRDRPTSGSTGYDRHPVQSSYDRDRDYDRYGGSVYGGSDYGNGGGNSAYDRGYYERGVYGGRPSGAFPFEMPVRGPASGYDNSINAHVGDGFGGVGPIRPGFSSRCDESDNFKQIGVRQKVRRQYVRRVLPAPSLVHCQRECVESKDFVCRSFNYRDAAQAYDSDTPVVAGVGGAAGREREREAANCELSDRDTRELDIQNPQMFDGGSFDYYERSNARSGSDGECLDVSQTCNEEGMEFTLRTPEGFHGRIYTYGFYDRCFFRGNGGTANILRISGAQGYPECGTQRNGDMMTNIVVVQFSDNVQTGRDKRFNLTCIFRGPGESVVTSGYIGAGSGSPIPIEYLPAENTLSSKVRLMILYQNRPTTTIAVGDPLTFRLEPQDGYNQLTDIFATNVVARDPYSGRSIQLIDRYGCPVDSFVFPELDKLRSDDSLEARFNAFKIPESNFLVFEATVRSCRDGCQPAYCPGQAGRSEPSFGRRRRSLNGTDEPDSDADSSSQVVTAVLNGTDNNDKPTVAAVDGDEKQTTNNDYPEHVREMIEVFESRDEMQTDSSSVPRKLMAPVQTICLSPSEYHGLISAVILLMILLLSISLVAGLAYRRYWATMMKNRSVDRSRTSSFIPSAMHSSHHTQFNTAQSTPGPSHSRSNLNLFNSGLQKTFATGNLSRMCQLPVMNPIRNSADGGEFDDPSEPIYTDPSLFERSRSLRSIAFNADHTTSVLAENHLLTDDRDRSKTDFY